MTKVSDMAEFVLGVQRAINIAPVVGFDITANGVTVTGVLIKTHHEFFGIDYHRCAVVSGNSKLEFDIASTRCLYRKIDKYILNLLGLNDFESFVDSYKVVTADGLVVASFG